MPWANAQRIMLGQAFLEKSNHVFANLKIIIPYSLKDIDRSQQCTRSSLDRSLCSFLAHVFFIVAVSSIVMLFRVGRSCKDKYAEAWRDARRQLGIRPTKMPPHRSRRLVFLINCQHKKKNTIAMWLCKARFERHGFDSNRTIFFEITSSLCKSVPKALPPSGNSIQEHRR